MIAAIYYSVQVFYLACCVFAGILASAVARGIIRECRTKL